MIRLFEKYYRFLSILLACITMILPGDSNARQAENINELLKTSTPRSITGEKIVVNFEDSSGVIEFGIGRVGIPIDITIFIGNTQSSLDIFALISKSSSLTFSDSSFSLPLFSSKIVTVSFSPPVEGTFTDTLEIHSDDAQLPVIAIPVRGTGILPEGEYWATGLHFGQVIRGGGVDSLRIPLVNTGALPLLIVSITHKAPGLSAVFSLSDTTDDIEPGDSSNVFISFLPSSDTLFLDTIVVLTDGKNIAAQEIIISGDAISPRIEVLTDSIDFGIVNIPDDCRIGKTLAADLHGPVSRTIVHDDHFPRHSRRMGNQRLH